MGKLDARIQWLVEYADNHGGLICTTDKEMQEAFCEVFPEVEECWSANPTITRTLREAYKRNLFSARSPIGRGGPCRNDLDCGTWSLTYERPDFRERIGLTFS